MKSLLKKLIKSTGFEIKRIQPAASAAYDNRPVGDVKCLLQDLKRRGLNCSYIMDVGANKGDWSRMAKTVFPGANFCLIEPQAEMKEYLDNFCSVNQGSFYILAGAGANNEVKTFTVWDDLLGSSFLPGWKGANNERSIELTTINDIIQQYNIAIPELIKLDIQGFELEALKGAGKTFGITEIFILEVSLFAFEINMPMFSDVINFMLERGYVVYDFPGFLRRPYDGALAQCDVCFVKQNSFLRNSDNWS